MVSRIIVVLLASALPGAAALAEEEKPEWDVSAPPGDARNISIDTRSGTWMSLDVSPDGNTIAFDLLGDIYVLPMAGGEARAINSGHAWSMQPRLEVRRIQRSAGHLCEFHRN